MPQQRRCNNTEIKQFTRQASKLHHASDVICNCSFTGRRSFIWPDIYEYTNLGVLFAVCIKPDWQQVAMSVLNWLHNSGWCKSGCTSVSAYLWRKNTNVAKRGCRFVGAFCIVCYSKRKTSVLNPVTHSLFYQLFCGRSD